MGESIQKRDKKFLGRHLMVKGKYVEKILKGEKIATIRKGVVKTKYEEMIVHGGGRPIAKIRIKRVYHKKVSELDIEDARKDGFNSLNELLEELKRTYNNITPQDIVTIIEFEVIQDLTTIEPQDPYLGLEPADIARLALRYLKHLTSDERKILLELTRSRSIRVAALRLFGNLSKRWIIRKTLKKALQELIKQGVIKINKK